MKKIKQEDARIEMRKKALAKNAERIAQARVKAAAAQGLPATEAPTPSQEVLASTVEPVKVEPPSTAPQSVAGSPLHPSLPPKPGTTVPGRALGTEAPSNAPAVAIPPVPAATTSAAASPTPAPPTDEQILKLEDVSVVDTQIFEST